MTEGTWFPLALSGMIPAGTSAGAVLEGAEIVVWRDTAGQAHTWEDRCPHRGMKLSFGFVRGDHIACLYHGWEYDAGGQCRYIPAHPQLAVPKTICIRTYGTTETGGMIWTGSGPVPVAPEATGVRSLYLDVALPVAVAALGRLGAGGAVTVDGALARCDTDLGPVTVGLQPVDAGHCALHIAMPGAPDAGTLVAMAARAEALRREVEA